MIGCLPFLNSDSYLSSVLVVVSLGQDLAQQPVLPRTSRLLLELLVLEGQQVRAGGHSQGAEDTVPWQHCKNTSHSKMRIVDK